MGNAEVHVLMLFLKDYTGWTKWDQKRHFSMLFYDHFCRISHWGAVHTIEDWAFL